MSWNPLNLARKDGHPEPGQLCVISRVWAGSPGAARLEYIAGTFVRDPRDPRDPASRKLWWVRGDGYARENPATWSGRYHDIQWLAVSGVRGGESDA